MNKPKSVTVTLHSQSGHGYTYHIETPLNSAICWRRGDRHSVHAYTRALERKLNDRWNSFGKLATGYGARRAGRTLHKVLQGAEKNEDL